MKRLIFFIACCFSLSVFAANPSFSSFNVNQFDVTGNRVSIKDSANLTNIVLFGSSSNLLEVWNSDNVLKFYIDTNGVPSTELWTNNAGKITAIIPSVTIGDIADDNIKFEVGTDKLIQIEELIGAEIHRAKMYSYNNSGSPVIALVFYVASTNYMLLDPADDFGTGTRYLLNSIGTVSSGDLLRVQNNTTNRFVVDYLGNITAAGVTLVPSTLTTYAGITNVMTWALSDMTTALTTGTNKNYWYAPAAGMTIKFVRATLATASSSGTPTFDINEAGTSILSTKITIDANEWDSFTAATPPVISDSAIAANAKVDFDIDVAGTAAAGAQIQVGFTVP